MKVTKATMTSKTPKKQKSPMTYYRKTPGALFLNHGRRPVVDPTPLPLVILSVDREGRLAGQVIRTTTILGQARQDLELDRPDPRDLAAQQAVLVAILPDLRDPCPVAQDPRHRGSIHLDPEPDPPRPVSRVALKAVLRPDRLPLLPSGTRSGSTLREPFRAR
ncbi:hypothetical protein PC116_g10666 [Phytophthora cactorum]|uniref:Uncharacterized protein n=1 Tax=Phytophthora cactorum TaxID=29920 RepID=A0A329S5E2_9STRA|nr:hypothetical protein Pcac1_g19016 [Phytophthora cactorum]KAG2823357.1 hypothetical protein PC111_g10264 [Phytophthora cactorum]KAG2878275.1 hypothetical protein PC114_g23200 [Phytophthora cactorum]KAG2936211.1 hypothetical protein PC117_g12164 [Phytophthora cactorum]KAG3004205.1 hypothetical protein PC120_g18707 [Phytophthora cactorum]